MKTQKSNIAAHDGSATISLGEYAIFLGATGPGDFPVPGYHYDKFTITPEVGTSGYLAFESMGMFFTHQYETELRQAKSYIRVNLALVPKGVSIGTLGFSMTVAGDFFVTHPPENFLVPHFAVDPLALLRFAQGIISVDDLRIHATEYGAETKVAALAWAKTLYANAQHKANDLSQENEKLRNQLAIALEEAQESCFERFKRWFAINLAPYTF